MQGGRRALQGHRPTTCFGRPGQGGLLLPWEWGERGQGFWRHRDPHWGLRLGAGVTGLCSPCAEPVEGMMRVVPWVGGNTVRLQKVPASLCAGVWEAGSGGEIL